MIRGNRLLAAATVALGALPMLGEDRDLTSLHQFNGVVRVKEKLQLTLHTRVRFNHDLMDFSQFRLGPIIFWDWKRRLQWQAGYYWVAQQEAREVIDAQRAWAGAQIRMYESRRFSIGWRNLLERHVLAGSGDFTRFRTRGLVNFQPKAGWQPYASTEALALRGRVIGRYAVGINYATARGHLFGLGYEFRPEIGRPGSHVITTIMEFRIGRGHERQKPGKAEAPQ